MPGHELEPFVKATFVDIRYWMAARTNRYPRASKAIAILVAGTDCGLGGRVHADPDAGRRASEN